MTDRSSGGKQMGLWLARFLEGAAGVVLFAMMAMTCIDVTGRYFFNAPLDGATELTQMMLAIVVFAVLPTATWREEHINVDLLDNVFPRRLVNIRQALVNLVSAVALGWLTLRIWDLAARTASYGDVTPYLGIPMAPVDYFIAVMAGATALALALNVVRYLGGVGPLSPKR